MSVEIERPEDHGFDSARLARIRPAMQAYVEEGQYPGISMLVARRGHIVHFEQVGFSDRDENLSLPSDAIYRIYSMTKPIVCVALMTLLEEGRFRLADPVAEYLPAFASVRVTSADGTDTEKPLREMTIRDLLTHTAGLTYDFMAGVPSAAKYAEAHVGDDADRTLSELADVLASIPLAFQPGTRWHYSMSIDVAARIVEVISGRRLQDFLRDRVFHPLGMKDTGFSVAPEKASRIAAMYVAQPAEQHSEQIDVENGYPSTNRTTFARGGHGLFSTTLDYFRFAEMLRGRGRLGGVQVISPKVADLMHMNHLPAELLPWELGGVYNYGYGFGLGERVLLDVAQSAVPGSVGEFGWSGAANTYYWVDPREELVGVIMTQLLQAGDRLKRDLRTLAYQALLEPSEQL